MERSHIYGVELSRLRNLCSEPQNLRTIHFRLESGTLPVRNSYLDLYIPEFYQYGSGTDRPVRHLDITSTWRQLSTAKAEELKFWEDMFAAVLEYTVSNHLIDLVDDMEDCNIDRYPGDLDGRICGFINKHGSKTFPVNVREIINCMLELYKRHGCQHQWLASSGNFYNALCEFLRTRDCFLDAPLHPTIKVAFSASLSGRNEPIVVGILTRFGPVMGFSRLDAFTGEQAWCEIRPAYLEPTLDSSYASCLGRPEYRLASDWVKFDWDSSVEGFRGYVRPVPSLGQTGVRTCLNVDLAVESKRFFPGDVTFERNLRVKIKLSVCRITTVSSPNDSVSTLQRCRKRRSLFVPPPGLQDLGEVMKANKRSAGSQWKKEKKPTPGRLPRTPIELWGKNVPAWEVLPDHDFSPVQVNRKQASSSRPRTSCLGRSLSDVFDDTDHYMLSPSRWPRLVSVQLKSPRSESSLPLNIETSDDEYVVVQPHQSSSPSDLESSSPPLEIVCPASAPHPSRRRADSVFGTSNEKRPASTTWVRGRNDDDEGLAGLSPVEERASDQYMPTDNLEEKVERFRRSIKEWYDAMLLKRDTPCKKTREERSQEEAFQEAFLGYDDTEADE